MTLKELSQLYWLNREIEADMGRLRELREKISAPSSSALTGMPRGGKHENTTESCIAEIIDMEAVIEKKSARCMRERDKLEKYIADIPDSLTRQIFTLRFINELSWRQVAFSVGGGNTEASAKMIVYRYLRKN